MSTAPAARAAAPGATLLTVGLCCLVAIFEGFDLQAAGVAAPKLGPAFQMSPEQLGWFFSASTFGLMLGAAIGGRLSDRYGRKAVLLGSMTVFGALSVATAVSDSVEMLLWTRFFTGVGLGGALPNLIALAAENTPVERRQTAVGLLYAGLPLGGALAALVSLVGAEPDDWRAVFWVGGLAPLVTVPLLLWILPESRELRAAKAEHVPGASIGRALFGLGRAPTTLLLWGGFFMALLTMYLLLNWLPTLLVGRGLTRPDASLVQMAFNIAGAVGAMTTGALLDRLGRTQVVASAFLAALACLVLLAFAPVELGISLIVGALVGASVSATQALLYAIAPTGYPTAVRGTGVGSAVAVGRLGSAAGPLLAAAVIGSGGTPQEVLMVLLPAMAVAGVAAVLLVRRARGDH